MSATGMMFKWPTWKPTPNTMMVHEHSSQKWLQLKLKVNIYINQLTHM